MHDATSHPLILFSHPPSHPPQLMLLRDAALSEVYAYELLERALLA